ncbi:hypothetical protein AB6A40_002792 [Gnathostoma spinigerum]|uniref:NTR domain-containing protein n=1 Tax=Gnathostoma spinigerum TaxID=75299 RepID=A0ABD6E7R2_9BILA
MILLASIIFSLVFHRICACRCGLKSRFEAFCGATWVAQATIIEKNEDRGANRIKYRAMIGKIYKGGKRADGEPMPIESSRTPGDCGVVDLEVGKTYLLAGDGANIIKMCPQLAFSQSTRPLEWKNAPKWLFWTLSKASILC